MVAGGIGSGDRVSTPENVSSGVPDRDELIRLFYAILEVSDGTPLGPSYSSVEDALGALARMGIKYEEFYAGLAFGVPAEVIADEIIKKRFDIMVQSF